MSKVDYIGNKAVVEYLNRAIDSQNFSHAYLFVGPEKIGKSTLAYQFAKSALCLNPSIKSAIGPCNDCNSCIQFDKHVHADFHVLEKSDDKITIPVEALRIFQRQFNKTTFVSNRKVGIINTADALNIEGSNALLKTLEEPPGDSIIILISSSTESLPLTVISRCQIIPFSLVQKSEIKEMLLRNKCANTDASIISSLSMGKPGVAVELFENPSLLDDYTNDISNVINIYSKNIPDAFNYVQQYLSSKKYQERLDNARQLLHHINIVLHDCVLIKNNFEKYIVNTQEVSSLRKLASNFRNSELVKHQKMINLIMTKFNNGINPQLALENYFLTMKFNA
ncbi:MAG: DNA polymerase III subunit delta' C-terminal domain-containing protein [Patescibacteria group bacterium]